VVAAEHTVIALARCRAAATRSNGRHFCRDAAWYLANSACSGAKPRCHRRLNLKSDAESGCFGAITKKDARAGLGAYQGICRVG
jgi:hypothetical protein